MFRAVLIILLSFQVIILFLLFYPSRYRLWGWCPILDTTFVQQAVQYGFHTFPYIVFNSAIWVGCSLFIITSFVVSIFSVTLVFKSPVLGLLKNCNWTGPRLQKTKTDQRLMFGLWSVLVLVFGYLKNLWTDQRLVATSPDWSFTPI